MGVLTMKDPLVERMKPEPSGILIHNGIPRSSTVLSLRRPNIFTFRLVARIP